MPGHPTLCSNVLVMVGLLVAVLAVASLFGAWWRHRSGRVRTEPAGDVLTAADLGDALGSQATLVQFSTSVCQPCRVTRVVLREIAGQLHGVRHVEIDAEERLDLVRRLDVLRTPTVFVLDERGRIVNRVSGAPRRSDMVAAVSAAVARSAAGSDGGRPR
jgi:thiol-disulfide isomerase/thioredoxin